MNQAMNSILSRLNGVKPCGNGWKALCPAHDDQKQSLHVSEGKDGRVLIHCHAGCSVNNICQALGIDLRDLFPQKPKVYAGGKSPIVATYDYRAANGKLLFQVCRTADKRFFQRRPDGKGGWINGLGDVKPVLYRLPEVLQALKQGETIFIPEGEKDVDNLARLGLAATCNPMGAGKWRDHYSNWLKGANVVILPDNDEPGRKHAQQVAQSLYGKAASVKVLELPGLPAKGDVSDWLEAGHTKEELMRLAEETPDWRLQPAEEERSEDSKRESQADALIRIATTEAFLFHDDAKDGFAAIPINGHREIWPLRSKFFKQWLVRRYYEQTDKSPNNEAIRQALNVIEAKAVFDGPEIKLNLRVAERDGALWYDLADGAWRAVRITPSGWEVVDNPPILFRRFKNTAAQVLPQRGGSLEALRKYINLKDDEDWLLLIALIVHAFVPGIPHAIPVFYGDKGAAKTTAQRVIRKLIDPAVRDTMTLPTDKNELALMLMTNYAPCFDNLDGLSPWQSDMLCQAATGGGISKRELYTDMEEVILSFLRCPMLNGINLVASRDDLLDRSVLFKLERIDEEERKTETEFWQEFEQDRPYILGAIFDVLSKAIAIYPAVRLPALPRMADFATWGYAITEAAGGKGEAFLRAYRKNIAGAVEEAVTNDIVGAAVAEFMDGKEEWEGTATELLEALSELPSVNTKERSWPKRPHTLTRRLNKIKAALADYGISVEVGRTMEKRCVVISNNRKKASQASYRHQCSNNGHLEHDAFMTLDDASASKASCWELPRNGHGDAYDGNDGILDNFQKAEEDQLSYCKYCGEPIEWAKDEGGRWIPMRPDYTGFHKCKEAK
jgi:5S rRNA maturation endonuclease (ribonuclease M5)